MINKIFFYCCKIIDTVFHSQKLKIFYFKKRGIKFTGDKNLPPHIFSDISKMEPWLISIGHNTTVAGNVSFITHDNSIAKLKLGCSNLFGKIVIGNNCFIGENSTILYGVRIANNVIVAAGSVVTKSFEEENIIIGGNPAKIISNWNQLKDKVESNNLNRNINRRVFKKNKFSDDFLVKR